MTEIGLIGATGIAERAILRPAGARADVQVRAVAASDPVRAKEFASRHEIPVVHQDYAALLADPEIDTVYISLHNSAHHRWAVRAAVAGKRVIVEKPLCLSSEELEELEFAAEDVQVFEAVATLGHPWQETVRGFVDDQSYGALQSVETRMTFAIPAPGGFRDEPELGGGIFRDSASYWLQALQATVGLDDVEADGSSDFDGPNGVDYSFHATLRWPTGVQAVLECAFGEQHVADHVFTFEQAVIKVRNFLRPMAGAVPVNLVIVPTDGDRKVVGFPASSYYDSQLTRILDSEADDLESAAPRIALMAEIYAAAKAGSA
ncbi:Gfo/Idh/MocA family protein [Kribbella qitaiheensis]|nr:Gfo/Idh/MocA family oxidoreductase [Kribbella qitaiheensis]